MSDEASEFDDVVDATVEQVAYNAQRMDALLDKLQRRLAQNYTHVPIIIGACMIVGGFLHILVRGEFSFSLTAMVWGSLIISLALFFHARVGRNLVAFAEVLIKVDQERQAHARKLAVVEQLFEKGMPGGLSLPHLLALLGENSGEKSDDEMRKKGSRTNKN